LVLGVAVAVLAAGCGGQRAGDGPAPASAPAVAGSHVDPGRIVRTAANLPPDYERGTANGVATPAGYWGFAGSWSANPAECGALLGAAGPAPAASGVSGSGAGGTLYIVVTPAPAFDAGLAARCSRWIVRGQHSSAEVSTVAAPDIDGADTLGLWAQIRTVVESGSQTDTVADTYIARLDEYTVFVTLITDPGAPGPPLAPAFAADLLVRSVALLRGR
jgi:hypothetical protein